MFYFIAVKFISLCLFDLKFRHSEEHAVYKNNSYGINQQILLRNILIKFSVIYVGKKLVIIAQACEFNY